MQPRLESTGGDQLGMLVIVADVEISIKGDGVGDDQIVRLVARPRVCPVSDKPPGDEDDNRRDPSTQASGG
jgi:hypothetical protein